ncbi:hypothetical protein IL306_004252 [Fusarium sp. DS 682]|nr:hypothetical protein IL306_004252 [Fusarium sp. DS 682]
MPPRAFLSLPYEIRHKIYRNYFTADEGYFFQPGSGKLAAADGTPLDLALMYTCTFIADETKDMPLSNNGITFSTVYHPEWSSWAGRFDYLLSAQSRQQIELLILGSHLFTPEIRLQIESRFPRFTATVERAIRISATRRTVSEHRRTYTKDRCEGYRWSFECSFLLGNDFYETDGNSQHRMALEYTLRLLAGISDERFSKDLDDVLIGWEYSGGTRLLHFLDRCYKPWDIPSFPDLEEMGSRFGDNEMWSSLDTWDPNNDHTWEGREKFRFSGVSVAIRFLNHLPTKKRLCLSDVVIREDHISVGHPECHAMGLIPFYEENPRLRISHQISMVNNIFQRAYLSEYSDFNIVQEHMSDETGAKAFSDSIRGIYPTIAIHLAEALFLPEAGMPDGAYTLTLDGDSAVDLCSNVFQDNVLRRDCMRLILEDALKTDPDVDLLLEPREISMVQADAFEQLINQTSFLRSTFNPGQPWSVDSLLEYAQEIGMYFFSSEFRFGPLDDDDHDFSVYKDLPKLGALLLKNFEYRPCYDSWK